MNVIESKFYHQSPEVRVRMTKTGLVRIGQTPYLGIEELFYGLAPNFNKIVLLLIPGTRVHVHCTQAHAIHKRYAV